MEVWMWFTAGREPEFVSKQKASPLTAIRNIQTLQISRQLHLPSERVEGGEDEDEDGSERQGGMVGREGEREGSCLRLGREKGSGGRKEVGKNRARSAKKKGIKEERVMYCMC